MPQQSPSPLATLDAVGHAELVRTGEATPRELVDAAIARIEKENPELNAVIHPSFERARTQASAPGLPHGPLRGVPFLMKDLGGQTAGDPYHAGMRFLRDAAWREADDSYFAARLRAAGAVFLGRTNTPELGLLPTTEPAAYGATKNPWDLSRSAGGSSGGAAAAVASGMVPVAHASDGGGSIRIPASHCGLVGLKTTRGRSSLDRASANAGVGSPSSSSSRAACATPQRCWMWCRGRCPATPMRPRRPPGPTRARSGHLPDGSGSDS